LIKKHLWRFIVVEKAHQAETKQVCQTKSYLKAGERIGAGGVNLKWQLQTVSLTRLISTLSQSARAVGDDGKGFQGGVEENVDTSRYSSHRESDPDGQSDTDRHICPL
jgi:hypothetical protein